MKSEVLSDVLGEFARTMLTDFPIQRILDHLCVRIVDAMPVSSAGVTLISPVLEPRFVAASNDSALSYEKLQSELGEGPCLEAYHTGEVVSVPDLRSESRFPNFAPRASAAGLKAVFTFPLHHEAVQLGALDLYRDARGGLSTNSLRAAQTLADVAAAYLINAQARMDLHDAAVQSRQTALHDALTGLPNRVLMLELLEHAFRASRRSGKESAVFFIDLDRFKDINDAYGHQAGDELLIAVTQRLTEALRPGDSLARLAGDEFVALCVDLEHPSQADAIAARLDAELAPPFALVNAEVKITASIGVAFTGPDVEAPAALLHNADLAMYRSKRERATSPEVLDPRRAQLAGCPSGLAAALHGAAERGEMHLEYQPIVDTREGRIHSVEALLRWTHPTRGPVPPNVFIPFAEQSGQIINLGRWVLERAWSERNHWERERGESLGVAINVSAHQFMSADFAGSVASVLARTAADPSLLTLEVTERVLVPDQDRAVIVMDALKHIGIKLALDDFGSGYSSLGYLESLPIDSIKVDPSFVARLSQPSGRQTVLSAIIRLAHSLGITVVSEGVETAAQRRQLANLGSDSCQGFYFAPPMSAASLGALIEGHTDGSNPVLPPPATAGRT
jgi:diguanylate cyclase (GGDEF)-like protein